MHIGRLKLAVLIFERVLRKFTPSDLQIRCLNNCGYFTLSFLFGSLRAFCHQFLIFFVQPGLFYQHLFVCGQRSSNKYHIFKKLKELSHLILQNLPVCISKVSAIWVQSGVFESLDTIVMMLLLVFLNEILEFLFCLFILVLFCCIHVAEFRQLTPDIVPNLVSKNFLQRVLVESFWVKSQHHWWFSGVIRPIVYIDDVKHVFLSFIRYPLVQVADFLVIFACATREPTHVVNHLFELYRVFIYPIVAYLSLLRSKRQSGARLSLG